MGVWRSIYAQIWGYCYALCTTRPSYIIGVANGCKQADEGQASCRPVHRPPTKVAVPQHPERESITSNADTTQKIISQSLFSFILNSLYTVEFVLKHAIYIGTLTGIY